MSFELPHKKDFATNAKLPGYLTENAVAIEQAINDLDKRITVLEVQVKKLNSSDINTEYITDTGVPSNTYDEAPTSVDIDDTVETTNDGLRILESKN